MPSSTADLSVVLLPDFPHRSGCRSGALQTFRLSAPDLSASSVFSLRICRLLPGFRPPVLPAIFRCRLRICQPLPFPASGSVSFFSFQPPDLSAPPGFWPPGLSNCRSDGVKSAKTTCSKAPDHCRTVRQNLAEPMRFTIQKCAGSCRLSHCCGPNAGPDIANIEKSCKLCNISGGKSEEDFRPKNHTYRHFTPPCAPCGRDARRDHGAHPARDADDAPAQHILRAWAAGPYAKA